MTHEAGVTRKTIRKGLQELEAGELYEKGRSHPQERWWEEADYSQGRDPACRFGGTAGAERRTASPGAMDDQIDEQAAAEALGSQGHTIGETAIRELLKGMGFSLKANKKAIEGTAHVDRDAQFQQINRTWKAFEAEGLPMISVDCKKKELIGNFKNNGREWQAKGQDTTVNVYDYRSIADGKAVPYGMYDVVHNSGFVNVGIDHETAEFAVESIRRWWRGIGSDLYPGSQGTPDCG